MAIDYRAVNKQLVDDSYPLPLLWEVLRHAAGGKYVVTFDVLSGFWNLPLTFGLKTAPAEFQRAIDRTLQGLPGIKAYVDDIIIVAGSWEELLKRLEDLLDALVRDGWCLKRQRTS
eukprot:GHVS01083454.1.p1 GENE.GHVS01083454.1~~GHVS01083454.1.p1  ORF type:complete len:116 (-),score=14.68 GHVS01083454.1:764-1111(-)